MCSGCVARQWLHHARTRPWEIITAVSLHCMMNTTSRSISSRTAAHKVIGRTDFLTCLTKLWSGGIHMAYTFTVMGHTVHIAGGKAEWVF